MPPFQSQSFSYESIGTIAHALEKLYAQAGIRIVPQDDLHKIISAGKLLATWWSAGKIDSLDPAVLPRALCCSRLGSCALSLHPVRDTERLRDLCSGSMMYWNNVISKAKNTEWELNVWAHSNQAGIPTVFAEPDLHMTFESERFGIACKKLYSEKNVDKQVSGGVHQIEESGIPGLLALSLDSLIQPNVEVALLKVTDAEEARRLLQSKLQGFVLWRKKRYQDRYFSDGRILGVLLSVQAFTDIVNSKERAIHIQESLIWTDESLPLARREKIKRLHESLSNAMIPKETILAKAIDILKT